MLTIEDLDYRIEGRSLFDKASAQIAAGWKVGLVGRNGTGKSTLLRLIREEVKEQRSSKSIRLSQGAKLGWVAQEVPATDDPIIELVLAADHERHGLMQEAETTEDAHRIAEIHTRLTDIDAWSGEARASEILTGMGFTQTDLKRPAMEFSGGWRMRAAIAGVLFAEPDLLLLDEPSNYLDLEGAAWLELYIKRYPHTVLIVSHDREMLNRCVTHTMALEHKQLSVTPGGYDEYLKLRAAKLAQLEQMKVKQDAERAHMQAYVDRFRYKASKARQAQARLKRIEKMQDVTIPLADRTVPFSFPGPEKELSPPMVLLENAELGYGAEAKILNKVNLRLDPDDRIVVVGINGQGKTTLVKSLAKKLPLIGGKRQAVKAMRVGYFSQDQMDELAEGQTVLDHVREALPSWTTPVELRSKAAQMGFSEEKIDTRVENLSGGEKVRLLLGLLAVEKPHLLILDEPTSHLDIDSREALIHGLNDYEGAVVLITHDIFLAEATGDQLWLVKDGQAEVYDGTLDDYRDLVLQSERNSRKQREADDPLPAKQEAKAEKRSQAELRRQRADAKKAAAPLKRKADELEKKLTKLHAQLDGVDAKLADAATPSEQMAELMQSRAKLTADIARCEEDWLEASEAYEAAFSS